MSQFNSILKCKSEKNQSQSRGASPHTRPRRTARPILLGCSKTPPTELKAPWAFSVLMLSRQTLVPDSTDAISASMPRSRNERKCPAATPRGGWTSVILVSAVNPKRVMPVLFFTAIFQFEQSRTLTLLNPRWPYMSHFCRISNFICFSMETDHGRIKIGAVYNFDFLWQSSLWWCLNLYLKRYQCLFLGR